MDVLVANADAGIPSMEALAARILGTVNALDAAITENVETARTHEHTIEQLQAEAEANAASYQELTSTVEREQADGLSAKLQASLALCRYGSVRTRRGHKHIRILRLRLLCRY